MPRGQVSLNSQGYVLSPLTISGVTQLVHKRQLPSYGDSFRLEGGGTQKAITERESRVFLPPTGGLGKKRIPADDDVDPTQFRRCFDATVDIRWPADVRLGILDESSTDPTNAQVVRASTHFSGDIWTVWERTTGAHDVISASYTGSTTTWTPTAIGGTGAATVPQDLIAHKTHMILLYAVNNDHITRRYATSWAAPTTDLPLNLLTNNVTANEDTDFGLLGSVGNEAIAILWHESNGTITFASSTDAGDAWTDEGVDIASGNGPQGTATIADADDIDKLWVATREGIYAVDTSVGTWTFELVFPMPPHNDNGRRMTIHQGKLYFAHGVDDNSPAPISAIETQGKTRVLHHGLGLNVEDGVPSEMLGPVRWMKSVGDMLFIALGGGAASRYARILCGIEEFVGGQVQMRWYPMFRHGTDNQKIEWLDVSADDDGTPRLHYALRTSSSNADGKFLGQPLVNPQSGVSIKRQASGYIDYPYTDLGMSTIQGSVLQSRVAAGKLSSDDTGEYINLDVGTDDTDHGSFANLGNILSGTPSLDHASGAGTEMFEIAHRVNLHRDDGTNTHSPQFRSLEVVTLKHVDRRYAYTFLVDIEATASANDIDTETVISNLETAENLKPLAAFTYGNIGTVYVKTELPEAHEDIVSLGEGTVAAAADVEARRLGTILVRCLEIV